MKILTKKLFSENMKSNWGDSSKNLIQEVQMWTAMSMLFNLRKKREEQKKIRMQL